MATGDPFTVWREMREREGPRASLIRLFALVAAPRGLEPQELPLAERKELAARAAYAAAKREAARVWIDQLAAYGEAKSDVILGILDQAEDWAAVTGWAV
jgi:hypothetical protein